MRYVPFFSLLLLAAVARGQDSPADRVSPYLTDDAIAVGRVDLAKLEVDAAFDRLAPFFVGGWGDAAEARGPLKKLAESLRRAGATEVFAVVAPADLPQGGPYFIIPTAAGGEVGTFLKDWLGVSVQGPRVQVSALPGMFAETIDGVLIVGPEAALDRLKGRKATAARPGLSEAFAAVSESPVQVVLTPSQDHRRVLREMLPDLPADFGGATGGQLAAGLRWGAVGVSFTPKLAAKLIVQAESEQAAETLNAAITAGVRRASTSPEVMKAFPAMPLFVGSLIPKREGDRLVLVGDAALDASAKLFGDVTGVARKAAGESQSKNNLKQIALAFHNFHDAYGSFPPNAGYDGDQPLLSWRVYLLPWLEQAPLYQEFRLDEPWDSEHNRKLVERMPDVFKAPALPTPPGHTVYLAPTGENLLFGGKRGMTIREITDGTSNTVLVVEAAAETAVPWTKPEDLSVDPANPLAGLIGGRESFRVAFGDGAVHTLPANPASAEFLKLLTPSGGESADWDAVKKP